MTEDEELAMALAMSAEAARPSAQEPDVDTGPSDDVQIEEEEAPEAAETLEEEAPETSAKVGCNAIMCFIWTLHFAHRLPHYG